MVSFTPRPLYPPHRAPGTNWIEGWVGPRAGLDDVEKRKFLTLPGLELRPFRRPVRSQLQDRLHYPGSLIYVQYTRKIRKQSYPSNRPWRPTGLWDEKAPIFSRQSAHRWRWSCQPQAPVTLYPQKDSWYSYLLEAESIPGPQCGWND
jgi:hypothetical protein